MTYEQAIQGATKAAKDTNENVYVASCQIYVDEFEEGPFIYGTKGVYAVMFNRLAQYGGELVAVVDPRGNVFCNNLDIVMSL